MLPMDFPEIVTFQGSKTLRKSIYAMDEVGRGPIAGPVVSCCVLFSGNKDEFESLVAALGDHGVTDSKKLSTKKRLRILEHWGIAIEQTNCRQRYEVETPSGRLSFFLYDNDHSVIDEINILNASLDSMARASLSLGLTKDDHFLVDGNKIPHELREYPFGEAIIKGDSKSPLIAMASIIAKEWRDSYMSQLALQYPHYGFEKHAGYPTAHHKEAIKEYGACPFHRKTFKGVKEYVGQGRET